MDRRTFLGATSLAAGVGLAGCGFIGSVLGQVPPPEVDQQLLAAGGWREDEAESGTVFT